MARRVSPGAILVLLVAASAVLRYWAATRVSGLWIMPDEAVYTLLGRSLYEDGRLAILDGPTTLYSVVYPALAGLPLALGDLERGYGVLKALQAFVMSLAAVPVYLWGRTLMRPRWALAAAALTLAVPALLYAGFVMTEVVFYPVLVLAAWTLARALERPSRATGSAFVAACVLAAGTRLQALVLLPVLLLALAVHAGFERSLATARRLAGVVGVVALLAVAWAAWRLHEGGSWTRLLGAYAAVGEVDYGASDVARSTLYHVADLELATGIVPLAALAVVVVEVARGRLDGAGVRAFAATAVALTVGIVAQVAVFASGGANRPLERDLIGTAPILFLALALWIDRGAPRPRVLTPAVALLALTPLLVFPVRYLVESASLPDAFTFSPWQDGERTDGVAGPLAELSLYLGGAFALAAFALLPRRLITVLPAAAFVFLGAVSLHATREVASRVSADQQSLLGSHRTWVDDAAADERVAFLYAGERYWNSVWHNLVWNRTIDRVYHLDDLGGVPGPLPQRQAIADDDGTLRVDGAPLTDVAYAVASSGVELIGGRVAEARQQNVDVGGHTLWRLAPPFRVSSVTLNVRPGGDMHEPGRLIAYDCPAGRLELTLLPKASSHVELYRNGSLVRRVDFEREALGEGDDRYWNGTVEGEAGAPRCEFEVRGSSLLGSTRFQFVRP